MLPGNGTTELSASAKQDQAYPAQVAEAAPDCNRDQEVNLGWHPRLRGNFSDAAGSARTR